MRCPRAGGNPGHGVFPRGELAHHLAVACTLAPVACLFRLCGACHEQVAAEALEQHQEDSCAETMVPCPEAFGDDECDAQVRRRELVQHRSECGLRAAACAQGCGVAMCARQAADHRCIAYLGAQLVRMDQIEAQLLRSQQQTAEFAAILNVLTDAL